MWVSSGAGLAATNFSKNKYAIGCTNQNSKNSFDVSSEITFFCVEKV